MNTVLRMISGMNCPCRIGAGDDVYGPTSTAEDLYDALTQNGCSASKSVIQAFQSWYNANGGTPTIGVDGVYGPCTQAALQATLSAEGASGSAPAPCVSGTCSGGSYVAPSTSSTTTPITTTTVIPASSVHALTSTGPTTAEVALIALGVAGIAGGGYYLISRHKKSRSR